MSYLNIIRYYKHMSVPKMTHETAQAIYTYAGTDGLPPWDSLAPTVQISYIEEAEAALAVVAKYVKNLGVQVELGDDEDEPDSEAYLVKATLLSIAHMIDPKEPELDIED
jgi:hypothetical protein